MAVIKDVRAWVRANVILEDITDQGDHPSHHGKNHGKQTKLVVDAQPMEMDASEFKTRMDNALLVMEHGYLVDSTKIPPKAVTADATLITKTTATINGWVTSGKGSAVTGFVLGTSRELLTGGVAADEGVTGGVVLVLTHRSYAWAGLTAGTKYYYRFVAFDAVDPTIIQYGIIKSFTTLPA